VNGVRVKKITKAACGIFLLFSVATVQANQFCFARAKTYYEQVYCELERQGKVKNLPPFEQFKNNNDMIQASLLRSPAERNGIKLPLPQKNAAEGVAEPLLEQEKNSTAAQPKPQLTTPYSTASSCQLRAFEIQCDAQHYQLLGNKHNKYLGAGVLTDTHTLALPYCPQGMGRDEYVAKAYRQYIDKMCAIGLAGVTMTYARFYFLYEDLQAKQVDFVKRFETMYSYLKQDKASMGISEKLTLNPQLRMQHCDRISQHQFVCALQGDNYIFELE
jgi:hypothetical protein